MYRPSFFAVTNNHTIHHTYTCSLSIHTIYITYNYTEKILIELKHNTKVKFKETDLFRVYQSIDLVSSSVILCDMCAYHNMLNSITNVTTPRLVIYLI